MRSRYQFRSYQMDKKPVLELKGITKRFDRVVANEKINLSLFPGEIHALLGENGSGKSTLMNIMLGIYKPTEGEVYYRGEKISMKSPKSAAALGIGMVHQHFALIPPLTVAENIFLGMEKQSFILDQRKMEKVIMDYSKKFGLDVDPSAKVWQLSVGEQQRVEIMKLLCRENHILVLDEPSAVLTPQEAEEMFKTLRKMANEGKSVIFISHKMNEVMNHADRITVLKNGKVTDEMLAADATIERLTKAVVGDRNLLETDYVKGKPNETYVLAEIENMRVQNDKGLVALHDISFQLMHGEIFGVAGVAGNGQRELAEVLSGLRKIENGKIIMNDTDITKNSIGKRMEQGIAFIPEDRLKMGLIPSMNMMENAILKEFRSRKFSKRGILKRKAIQEVTKTHISKHDIKHGGTDLPISFMSGGNQQKLLIAREINGNPQLIIAAYPVRGLDIGATASIHQTLIEQRDRGACVVLISEELDEIFQLSDRVMVLCGGKMMGIKNTAETSYEEIGRMMSGSMA